jgi:hypothetical protein
MTLKEKFLHRMYYFMASGMLSDIYDKDIAEDNAKYFEQITDEFAIEFANWLRKEDTPENAEKWFGYSDQDMLAEFKKEKGL